MVLEIDNILHNIKDDRRGLFILDSQDRTDAQTIALEDARLALNEFAHTIRIVEYELGQSAVSCQ